MPFTSELPSLPLVCPSNCGLGTFTLDDGGQALARVLALERLLQVLGQRRRRCA